MADFCLHWIKSHYNHWRCLHWIQMHV